MNWFTYSLFAAIFLAIYFLLTAKIGRIGHITVAQLNLYIWIISSLILLFYLLFSKQSISIQPSSAILVGLTAIAFLIGNMLLIKGVYLADNPGYATAIGSAQVLIVLLVSFFIFNIKLSLIKLIGGLLIVAGVVLLGL